MHFFFLQVFKFAMYFNCGILQLTVILFIFTYYTAKRRNFCWDSGNVTIINVTYTNFQQMATKPREVYPEWNLFRFKNVKIMLLFTKSLHGDKLRYTPETKNDSSPKPPDT